MRAYLPSALIAGWVPVLSACSCQPLRAGFVLSVGFASLLAGGELGRRYTA